MATLPHENRPYSSAGALDRAFEVSRLNYELIGYALLVLASIVAHLWALGHMAMHHDESIHAWMSWKFFTGAGGFTCAGGRTSPTYCYDPVYHGPSLYVLTLISYFLFGVGEAQARLPQAMAGIALIGSCWMLRPLIGRRGAFTAAVLLTFAPSILYYTRFARHDGLMLLWTFWIVVGFFRWLSDGRSRWLYLLAVGAALATATHELYYILIFLFGFFMAFRVAAELLPQRTTLIGLAVLFGVALLVEVLAAVIPLPDKYGGIALLVATVAGSSLLIQRFWDTRPILVPRARALWQNDRGNVWGALGVLLAIYVLLFSVFFTDWRGIFDGAYQGIAYWLGSQQEYARGKQPWYYYLMLMPLYEPLGFFGAISVAIALLVQRRAPARTKTEAKSLPDHAEDFYNGSEDEAVERESVEQVVPFPEIARAIFPLFLVFWFIGSLIAFSWAGEKMPWLVTHIALPGNLLFAWGLGELITRIRWRELPPVAAVVPLLILLTAISAGVVLWRLSPSGNEGMDVLSWVFSWLVPLLVVGLLIYAILTVGQRIGAITTLLLSVLVVSGLLGAYMIRASWMVVYDHPDTPRELLIYTQSSPDVPLIVQDLKQLAINQTRNSRSADDPAGGNSMPVIIDIGDSSGDGSLSWPFQWYLRDFQRLENRNADFFRDATANSFEVSKTSQPEGQKELAPAILVYGPHVTSAAKAALEQNYTMRYDTKLNWWFPEGDLTGCNPKTAGYKQFFYNTLTVNRAKEDKDCASIDFSTAQYSGPLTPLFWPFDRANWPILSKFVLWREFPSETHIDGRQMQMWVRKDLTSSGSATSTSSSATTLRLLSEQTIGSIGNGNGQLAEPRGIVVDASGRVFVADTGNNRVEIFAPDGSFLRSIGSFGTADGQFNEPRGLALDEQGNLYVADTWNARIQKFDANGNFVKAWGEGKQDFGNGRKATSTDRTEAGNQAEPLGFFGPRGVAVDSSGNVYIADTGNRRIVVTDTDGNYRYQFGYEGAGDGQFSEPIGVAVDAQGSVYVADTWNSRVQKFSAALQGQQVGPTPSATWTIPGWEANTYDDPYIAVGANGVYVTVPGQNQALYLDPTGQQLLRWGGAGGDAASMNKPSGITIGSNGDVYVADRDNGRILRFNLPAIAAPAVIQ